MVDACQADKTFFLTKMLKVVILVDEKHANQEAT